MTNLRYLFQHNCAKDCANRLTAHESCLLPHVECVCRARVGALSMLRLTEKSAPSLCPDCFYFFLFETHRPHARSRVDENQKNSPLGIMIRYKPSTEAYLMRYRRIRRPSRARNQKTWRNGGILRAGYHQHLDEYHVLCECKGNHQQHSYVSMRFHHTP